MPKITIIVKPNSTKGPLVVPQLDGSLIVYIRQIAADGKANRALIMILAKHFSVSKSKLKIVCGLTSRHKVVELSK